eukprot:gb/GFBE01028187.1/.p1 GENE.gb/GFBE01028187.1/~~gb/GFBE01028187.1/.p1  ORF type:complete len:827 (+),score=148.05 gb/GFBE01028187.1/:1-2481(+)
MEVLFSRRRSLLLLLLLSSAVATADVADSPRSNSQLSWPRSSVRGRALQEANNSNVSGGNGAEGPRTCPPKPVVSILDQKPMCQFCSSITIEDPVKRCMYNVSKCDGVQPGQKCEIDCAAPYVRVGNTTDGSCAEGNSIPNRMLTWDEPQCICPEPDAQQGYRKDRSGAWQCSNGFAGTPVVECEPLPGCAGVNTYLTGCKKLQPCAMPSVDTCRYDVSRCTSVEPGGSCQVHCQKPLLGNYTVAVCKDLNTDENQELDYYPLTCLLEDCPDPSPWPEGYNKTADGKWVCAEGYNGTARNRCELGNSWKQDCAAVAALSGCYKVVNCMAPQVEGLDACKYDMAACQSVAPGETCEVHCKNPFTGVKTTAYCPEGNVNPNGLVWTPPPCALETCGEPGNPPAGYMRMGGGWQCAQSYTGFAVKECEPTLSCEARPVLTGCAQLVPCLAPQGDCRFDMYGCISVQPGQQCQIECKAPFAGTVTQAACPSGNTDPNGLVWSFPTCEIKTCADPPSGGGYRKVQGKWECAPGYSGTVVKTCRWVEAECRAEPELSGCQPEAPCKLPAMSDVERCMYDTSDCMNVLPGKLCSISCQAPYLGPSEDFSCPVANTDPDQLLQGILPVCGCGEQIPLPQGYNMTISEQDLSISYHCEPGYGGRAEKLCQPGAGFVCTVDPVMVGCAIPMACEGVFVDDGSGEGVARGDVNFGPALLGSTVDEADVRNYLVFWADSCEEPMGREVGRIAAKQGETCCRVDVYSVSVRERPPTGATGFVVVAELANGLAPRGVFVELDPELMTRTIAMAAAPAAAQPAFTTLILCALAFSGLLSRR